MFRQKTGSVVCASCGSLVGVNDDTCYTCGRRNPGLWGFGPVLRRFGNDFGFTTVIVYGCVALFALSLVLSLWILQSGVSTSVFVAPVLVFVTLWSPRSGPAIELLGVDILDRRLSPGLRPSLVTAASR